MRRALMQLQRRGNLRKAQRRIALRQKIQYGECPVQSLNLIDALRGCFSHDGPLFRQMIPSPVS